MHFDRCVSMTLLYDLNDQCYIMQCIVRMIIAIFAMIETISFNSTSSLRFLSVLFHCSFMSIDTFFFLRMVFVINSHTFTRLNCCSVSHILFHLKMHTVCFRCDHRLLQWHKNSMKTTIFIKGWSWSTHKGEREKEKQCVILTAREFYVPAYFWCDFVYILHLSLKSIL